MTMLLPQTARQDGSGVMKKYLMTSSLLLVLGGCGTFQNNVDRGYAVGHDMKHSTTFTTADVRTITMRNHPKLNNPVICSEPAPDVANALSTALAASIKGGYGAGSGSLGANASSAEAVAELAGRSTALLGLRDGLFRACEAYQNGALGQNAYGLVISRYSQLMTTLFLAQDITGAAGAEGKAAFTSGLLQAPGAPADSSSNTTSPAPSSPGNGKKGATPAAYTTLPGQTEPKLLLVSNPGGAGSPPAAAADASPTDTSTTPQGGSATPAASPQTAKPQSASGVGVSTAAALSLTRMNEDYLNQGPIGSIIVSCINEYDRTRFNLDQQNDWLRSVCGQLESFQTLRTFVSLQQPTDSSLVHPEVAAGQLTPGPQVSGDPTIRALEVALAKQSCTGCDIVRTDGVFDSTAAIALRAYQAATKGLTINGDPFDAKTLAALSVKSSAASPAPTAHGAKHPKARKAVA